MRKVKNVENAPELLKLQLHLGPAFQCKQLSLDQAAAMTAKQGSYEQKAKVVVPYLSCMETQQASTLVAGCQSRLLHMLGCPRSAKICHARAEPKLPLQKNCYVSWHESKCGAKSHIYCKYGAWYAVSYVACLGHRYSAQDLLSHAVHLA